MNKIHRVVWSKVRNCFVVANEHARTNGKASSTTMRKRGSGSVARKALSLAVASLFLAPGFALSDQTITTPQSSTVSAIDENVTIVSTIQVNDASAVDVNAADYTQTFINTSTGTISSTATNLTSGSQEAYGIFVSSGISATGSISNAGSITATAIGNSYSDASAYGIYAYGNLDGTLTNSGSITASATGSDATAYGIYIDSDIGVTGSLTNSGAINVTANATSSGSDAYAQGIYVNGDVLGTLDNSGTITVTATSLDSDAYSATGIYVDGGVGVDGSIINSGTITATATAYSYASSAIGIYVDSTVDGVINNSGTITATADATSGGYAYAYGVLVDSDLSATGSIVNSGNISANASNAAADTDTDVDYAYAYTYAAEVTAGGILIDGSLNGAFSNAGVLAATASSSAQASSTMTSDADNGSDYAFAYAGMDDNIATGLHVDGDVNGSLINAATGTISATAESESTATATATGDSDADYTEAYSVARSYAWAYGIHIDGDLAGSDALLRNDGTINATANADVTSSSTASSDYAFAYAGTRGRAYARAYGILIDGVLSDGADLVNNGAINAMATSNGASTATGSFTEDDSFGADAWSNNYSYARAYGISLRDGLATGEEAAAPSLTNNGDITATATANSSSTASGTDDDVWARASGSANSAGLDIGATWDGSDYISLDGTIINNDTITASGNSTVDAVASSVAAYDNANAYANGRARAYSSVVGAYLSGYFAVDATFDNNGVINANAESSAVSTADADVSGDYAYAYAYGGGSGSVYASGIRGRGLLEGASMTNDGIINIAADTSHEATATANADSDLSDAYAKARDRAYAQAYGILISSDLDMDAAVDNADTITVSATAASSANAIATGGAGSVAADAYSYAYAAATGIYVGRGYEYTSESGWTSTGSLSEGATVTNSGTISVSSNATAGSMASATDDDATASAYARAYGIQLRDYMDVDSAITNSGDISVMASATATATASTERSTNAEAYAIAYGISVGSNMADGATVTNTETGTISVSATGDSWARAYGIDVSSLSDGASIDNRGTIDVTAAGGWSSYVTAYGIRAGSLSEGASITNSGTITAKAPSASQAYSIHVNSGSGTVSNSGTLNGSIDLGGTVDLVNTGTVNIPAGNLSSMGYGYVGGNYTQGTGGVLSLGAIDTGNYTVFEAGGTADFTGSGAIFVKVDPENDLTAGDVLAGAVATGAGVTAPNGFTVTDNNIALAFTGAIDESGNNVDLTVASTGVSSLGSLFDNSGSLGALLDKELLLLQQGNPGALGSGVDTALLGLTSLNNRGAIDSAVHQLDVLVGGSTPRVLLGARETVNGIIHERQSEGRGAASGDFFAGNRNAWLKPFGSWADQDNDGSVLGYNAKSYGMALGIEGDTSADKRIGLAFAYYDTKVEQNDGKLQQDKIKSYQLIGYGSANIDSATFVDYQVDIARHTSEGRRNSSLFVGAAKSDFDSTSYHLGAGIGHTYALANKASFTNILRADYTKIKDEGYTETGAAGFNLTVGDHDVDTFVISYDGRYEKPMSETSTFTANAGVAYDAKDSNDSITAAFAGAPSSTFTTKGIEQSKTTLHGGLGWVMKPAVGTQVTLRYDVEGRSGFTNQTASVKARWAF